MHPVPANPNLSARRFVPDDVVPSPDVVGNTGLDVVGNTGLPAARCPPGVQMIELEVETC
jgi:hypothetical protein